MYVSAPHARLVRGGQKRVSDPLEPELQTSMNRAIMENFNINFKPLHTCSHMCTHMYVSMQTDIHTHHTKQRQTVNTAVMN